MTIFAAFSYLVVLTVAELFRLRMPGRFETAPTAQAVGFALAVSVSAPFLSADIETWHVAVIVCASQVIAVPMLCVARGRGGRREVLIDSASRLVTVLLVSVVVRDVPLLGGLTVADVATTWPGWRRAIVLISAIGFVVSLETPVRVWLHHRLVGGDGNSEPQEDVRISAALSVVLVASGVTIALAQEQLGLAALPLGLVSLVITQVTVLHQARVQRAHRQSVRALSRLPELAGLIPHGHGASVARLSVAIGQEMALTARDVAVLETAGLLHDLGLVVLRRPIPSGATVLAAPADAEHLAAEGAAIVVRVGRLNAVADTVAKQSMGYHQLVQRRARIPQVARVLKVANAYVDYVGGTLADADVTSHEEAMERIFLGLGYEYDPKVVNALERVLGRSGYGTTPAAETSGSEVEGRAGAGSSAAPSVGAARGALDRVARVIAPGGEESGARPKIGGRRRLLGRRFHGSHAARGRAKRHRAPGRRT